MQYEVYREEDTAGEPSIADMVEKAINILKRSDDGYFLFVEGIVNNMSYLCMYKNVCCTSRTVDTATSGSAQ